MAARDAVRRTLRDPRQWIAIGLLAATAASALALRSPADGALAQAGREGWSGAYDILVTSAKAKVGVDGMLPPNTLSSETSGMTLAQLAKVRTIAGVDVAAPLGAAEISGGGNGVRIDIPEDMAAAQGARSAPQGYDVMVAFLSDDGTGQERSLTDTDARYVLDLTPPGPVLDSAQDPGCVPDIDKTAYPLLYARYCGSLPEQDDGGQLTAFDLSGNVIGEGSPDQGVLSTWVSGAPSAVQRAIVIDPAAEQKLLGSAGTFLSPLVQLGASASIDDLGRWADGADTSSVYTDAAKQLEEQQQSLIAQSRTPDALAEQQEADSWNIAHPDRQVFSSRDDELSGIGPFAPVLYTPIAAELTATVMAGQTGPVARDLSAESGAVSGGDVSRHYVMPAAAAESAAAAGPSTRADASSVLDVFGAQLVVAWPGSGAQPQQNSSGQIAYPQLAEIQLPDYRLADDGRTATVSPRGYVRTAQNYDGSSSGQQEFSPAAGAQIGTEAAYFGAGHSYSSDSAEPMFTVGGIPTGLSAAAAKAAGGAPLGAYTRIPATVTRPDGTGFELKPAVDGLGITSSDVAAIMPIGAAASYGDAAPIGSIRVRVSGIRGAHGSGYDASARTRIVSVAQAVEKLGLKATIVVGSRATPVTLTVAGYAFGDVTAGGAQKVGTLGTMQQQWTRLGPAATAALAVAPAARLLVLLAGIAAVLVFTSVQLLSFAGPQRGGLPAAAVSRRRRPLLLLDPVQTVIGFGLRQSVLRGWLWAAPLLGVLALAVFGVASFGAIRSGAGVSVVWPPLIVGLLAGVALLCIALPAVLSAIARDGPALRASGWTAGERLLSRAAECAVVLLTAVVLAALLLALLGSRVTP